MGSNSVMIVVFDVADASLNNMKEEEHDMDVQPHSQELRTASLRGLSACRDKDNRSVRESVFGLSSISKFDVLL